MKRLSAAFLLWPVLATAKPLTCVSNERTDATYCIQDAEVREEDGIRTAPLYMGGPKEVDRSGYYLAANCQSKVMHLKDRRGVSFAGGDALSSSAEGRNLFTLLCTTTLKAKKK